MGSVSNVLNERHHSKTLILIEKGRFIVITSEVSRMEGCFCARQDLPQGHGGGVLLLSQ